MPEDGSGAQIGRSGPASEAPTLAIGVGRLVERLDRAKHLAGTRIDQIDPASGPSGRNADEPRSGGDNAAGISKRAPARLTVPSERRCRRATSMRNAAAVRGRIRAVATDIGAGQIARQGVVSISEWQRAVIFLFDPGLGGLIEQVERQRLPRLRAWPSGALRHDPRTIPAWHSDTANTAASSDARCPGRPGRLTVSSASMAAPLSVIRARGSRAS
jgi:hypothetical protein